jgi:cell fate (sporulation/competence/biofilm development) regulator YlbF (YheA/YmcA/DUF963 family)
MNNSLKSILICTLIIASTVFAQQSSNPIAKLLDISNNLSNHVSDLGDYQLANKDENVARNSIADNRNVMCAEIKSMLSKLALFSLITTDENRNKGIQYIKSDIEQANKVIDFLITNTNQNLSFIKNMAVIQNGNEVVKLFRDTKEAYAQIGSALK